MFRQMVPLAPVGLPSRCAMLFSDTRAHPTLATLVGSTHPGQTLPVGGGHPAYPTPLPHLEVLKRVPYWLPAGNAV